MKPFGAKSPRKASPFNELLSIFILDIVDVLKSSKICSLYGQSCLNVRLMLFYSILLMPCMPGQCPLDKKCSLFEIDYKI